MQRRPSPGREAGGRSTGLEAPRRVKDQPGSARLACCGQAWGGPGRRRGLTEDKATAVTSGMTLQDPYLSPMARPVSSPGCLSSCTSAFSPSPEPASSSTHRKATSIHWPRPRSLPGGCGSWLWLSQHPSSPTTSALPTSSSHAGFLSNPEAPKLHAAPGPLNVLLPPPGTPFPPAPAHLVLYSSSHSSKVTTAMF